MYFLYNNFNIITIIKPSHHQSTKKKKILLHTIYSLTLPLQTKKSLKKPKGQSESINRKTNTTMDKRKSTKGQTTIYKTYTYN